MRRFPQGIAAGLAILNLSACNLMQKPWWEKHQKPETSSQRSIFGNDRHSERASDDSLQSSSPTNEEVAVVKSEVENLLARLEGKSPNTAASQDEFDQSDQPFTRSPRQSRKVEDPKTMTNAPVSTDLLELDSTKESRPGYQMPRAAPRVGSVSVRANNFDMNSAYVSADPSANYPVSTDAPMETSTLDSVIEILEERVQRNPDNLDDQWSLQMLRIAAGRSHEAGYFPTMTDRQTAELLQKAVHTALAARRSADDPDSSARIALAAIDELRQSFLSHADLEIPTVALCRKVTTFGVYDPLPATALRPNRAVPVIVYSEIAHFQSKTRQDGLHQTLLSSRLELFNAIGQSIWKEEQQKIEDIARRRRQDFFMAQLVEFPPMPPGDYTLKVTVQDTNSGRMNEAIHNFEIKQTTSTAEMK